MWIWEYRENPGFAHVWRVDEWRTTDYRHAQQITYPLPMWNTQRLVYRQGVGA